MELLSQAVLDYTLRNVVLGSALLGLIGGVLGAFALLRQQSLFGDVLAHAALPGICLAFLLTGSKTPSVLLLGGGLAGWAAALWVLAVLRHTRLPQDAALGVALSGFFGLGVTLLTFIQHGNQGNPAGLDRFIFGQAAGLLGSDVVGFALLGGVTLALVGLFYKEFKLITFDPAYATSLGLPTRELGILLTSLIVLAVMVGLQTVGVVLMAAMLVAPAAAARQWTNRLGRMVWLSGLLGASAGVAGALLSASRENLPTGPLIVLSITAVVFFSLFFAPLRGLFWQGLRTRQNRRRTALERLLLDAHLLANHGRLTPQELALHRGESLPKAWRHLNHLRVQGWVEPGKEGFRLTELGLRKALALEEALRPRS
ncbi:MAG: metal ABC transporter permease [Meiothermus sp.]|uniref:metal ABC transporter permease n=1 Tax=Meiothermus sp. TaxID=1955249 RepID=UPI0025E82D97|nr:iron chelate uptake ABC transporter family permease subunit [Meiothermus sp.]MCS7058636.1 metal ABC transporter permease [Meiothermus sp.]MCS7193896.1 metal ABC transporter permease [Meiothermus sp.]MCX7739888.1 metal ABC transporter permease [Meiothermus sp.]MDW8090158.1 iron chelate uptake ABC transporter family permease subunit [Meiothermus sp.]MDW8481460.1 iron chelate uptake ABC transporter family permease subunit [Meiothermus sp.]